MGKNIISFLALGGVATITSLVPTSAHALILFDISTNIRRVDNFWYGTGFYSPVQDNEMILGFNEAQKVTLKRNVGYQETINNIENKWDDENLDNFMLQGRKVSSHMIYLSTDVPNVRVDVSATIKFDRPIIGFNADFDLFRLHNDLFAPNSTITGPTAEQSLEGVGGFLPADLVTRIDDWTIQVDFTQASGTDPLRVFTAEHVPEPLTIMGSGLALGLGYLFKRKSLANNK